MTSPRELLLAHAPQIQRVVAGLVERYHLRPETGSELLGYVRYRLLADDCAVLSGYTGGSTFESYLSVALVRLFQQFCQERGLDIAGLGEPASTAEPASTPAAEDVEPTADPARVARLATALRRLGSRDRLILMLRYPERLSVAEIAFLMKEPPAKVERHLAKLIAGLRREMAGDRFEELELPVLLRAVLAAEQKRVEIGIVRPSIRERVPAPPKSSTLDAKKGSKKK
jgi:RNA polymerase sigma factor (sigma-70 family)